MNSIICKEPKTTPKKILSVFIMTFAVLSFWFGEYSLFATVFLFCIGLIWLGVAKAFKITKDFTNEVLYLFFGMIVLKSKLDLEFPDYISVFNASFVDQDDDGSETRFKKWVVRFFKDNTHFTVLKLDDYNKALEIANDLGELLHVEVYDTSKE